jgi:hypothetical protein
MITQELSTGTGMMTSSCVETRKVMLPRLLVVPITPGGRLQDETSFSVEKGSVCPLHKRDAAYKTKYFAIILGLGMMIVEILLKEGAINGVSVLERMCKQTFSVNHHKYISTLDVAPLQICGTGGGTIVPSLSKLIWKVLWQKYINMELRIHLIQVSTFAPLFQKEDF